MLKTDVEDEAKIAHMYTDEALVKHILQKAEVWSIPIGTDNIEIIRDRSDITIAVHYTVTLNFLDRYTREINYEILIKEPLKETSRILQ